MRKPLFAVLIAPLVSLVVGLPILVGLAGTLAPAFGYLPALGGETLSFAPWHTLLATPGFAEALRLTLTTGISATVLSVVLALLLVAATYGHPALRAVERLLAPILATPHAALAVGFAFLIAPSGWLARLVSPWASGWETPPDVTTIGHPSGITIIVGLLLKEVPYLVLMILAALNQLPARQQLRVARALGYGAITAWLKVIAPQVLPQIRLPVFAVLAFSLSTVDIALLLGPSNPPTLAVLVLRAFADYNLANYFPASAAASLLLVITLVCVALALVAERSLVRSLRSAASNGIRTSVWSQIARAGSLLVLGLTLLTFSAMLVVALWSFADTWRFPAALPAQLSFAHWQRLASSIGPLVLRTFGLAAAVTLVAAILCIALLESQSRRGSSRYRLGIIYIPLIVPQIAFLFGVQVVAVRLGLDGKLLTVAWLHLVFALPYFYLSFADAWHALDPRFARAAASLGASPGRVLFQVKLPLLLRPLLIACAVAFAVSIGQYLATVFAGNGRIATLTTEALTLGSGGDRRTLAVYALLQMALPFLIYFLAYAIPRWRFRHRQGLRIT